MKSADRKAERQAAFAERRGFTLIELLVVITIIGILGALLLPALAHAKAKSRQSACFSNLRQVALAARLYMDDYNGSLFHHHEGWVLDDGTQVDQLPARLGQVSGGGAGNSQAEKPWVIFLQPYLGNRHAAFCPSDPTPRSQRLATDLNGYNGSIARTGQTPPATSELATAAAEHLTMESYLLNSKKPPWCSGAVASIPIRAGSATTDTARVRTTSIPTAMSSSCRGARPGSTISPTIACAVLLPIHRTDG